MRVRHRGWMTVLGLLGAASAWGGNCRLLQLGPLPVTLHGLRPTVRAGINGHRAAFLLNSGAAYGTISQETAARDRLALHAIPGDSLYLGGAGGGMTRPQLATVKTFSDLSAPLHPVPFLVVPEHDWGRLAGSLGQNLLRVSDVEYDLTDGVVRFLRPDGCAGQPLAYWADTTPYSGVKLRHVSVVHSQMLSHAEVNGRRITVLLDPGAPRSILSLQAARRAGITRHSPGVTPLGAAALMRRGLALAAMREFRRAIADLSQACRLAPHDAHDRHERGTVYLAQQRDRAALADFDAALRLAPRDVQAHRARAELRLEQPDAAAHRVQIDADLAAVARRAAHDAALQLKLGILYGEVGRYRAGLAQINRWLATHRPRSEQATGLNARCWLRGRSARALHRALADCNEALNLSAPETIDAGPGLPYLRQSLPGDDPAVRDSRALVYLRLGRNHQAIRDSDAVLAHAPYTPTALYGRNLAVAQQRYPRIGAEFRHFGLAPPSPAGNPKHATPGGHTA